MRRVIVFAALLVLICGCTSSNDRFTEMSIEEVSNNMSELVGEEIKIEGILGVSYTSKGKDITYLQGPKGNIINLAMPGQRDDTRGWDLGDRYLEAGKVYSMSGKVIRIEQGGVYYLYSLNVSKVD
jgi:hypothetical protein